MADFHKADKLVRRIEGGYVNNPNDTGKETYQGISRRSWPNERIWSLIDIYKSSDRFPHNLDSNALDIVVDEFYQRNFWRPIKGGRISSQLVANQVYDIAVNAGVRQAGKYLQRTLNLLNRQERDYLDIAVDGAIGGKTLLALESLLRKRKLGVYLVGFYMLVQMGGLWVRLASKDKRQEDFMNGWGKRGLTTASMYAKHYFGIVK